MTDRSTLIASFLTENNLKNYSLEKIAGDASFRNYFRAIPNDGKSLIIMDAPPDKEDIHPFYEIDQFLVKNNFSAPKIFATDYQNGLLLLEDFGDESYTKILTKSPVKENDLYQLATDLLLALHKIPAPHNLPIYDPTLLLKEVMLFVDWYLPFIAKKPMLERQIELWKILWLELFSKMQTPSKLVLRDYHADNLMLLPKRNSYQQVGLLDFQDALLGSAAYDLVSLFEDARRDVNPKIAREMIDHYLRYGDCEREEFLYDYQLLSLQRNIKIIGIFARLAIRDKKENYLNFLPRVFNYVSIRLETNFTEVFKDFLPYFIF